MYKEKNSLISQRHKDYKNSDEKEEAALVLDKTFNISPWVIWQCDCIAKKGLLDDYIMWIL